MVPTAEYVANLESAMEAATAEMAAYREDAAARREAESKVCGQNRRGHALANVVPAYLTGRSQNPRICMAIFPDRRIPMQLQKEEARKKHEAAAQEEKKNAIAEWLDLLASQVRRHHAGSTATASSANTCTQLHLWHC